MAAPSPPFFFFYTQTSLHAYLVNRQGLYTVCCVQSVFLFRMDFISKKQRETVKRKRKEEIRKWIIKVPGRMMTEKGKRIGEKNDR